jgi:cation diffusion facilitator CzcD-associated flavoprotein CzcO
MASLVVIGAGPYGIATAAAAAAAGIETVVVGRPLSFWTDHMPAGMYLRSGPDWHLDAAGVHTFAAFLEERGIAAADIDPVPVAVFLDYARWFQSRKRLTVRECLVTGLRGLTATGRSSSAWTTGRRSPPGPWWPRRACGTSSTGPGGAGRCPRRCAPIPASWCASATSPAPGC